MKIVVGGGTGFIGSALVRALKMRGDQVTVLSLNTEEARRHAGPGVEVREWHPPQPGPWMEVLDGADAVVNLAGAPVASPMQPWTAKRKAIIRDSRVDSTAAIVEAISQARNRPAVFVSQSATGYYGGTTGAKVLTEESPPGEDFLADVCQAWEAAASPAAELGVRVVHPRTGIVLGHGGLLAQITLPFKLYIGGTMGYPQQWISWIHLEDEVDLIIHALTHDDVRGPINATAPNPVTMDLFSREIGRALSRPVWAPFYGPLLKLVLGKRAEAVLASQRVIPERAQATGYMFRHAQSGEAIRSILGPAEAPSL